MLNKFIPSGSGPNNVSELRLRQKYEWKDNSKILLTGFIFSYKTEKICENLKKIHEDCLQA